MPHSMAHPESPASPNTRSKGPSAQQALRRKAGSGAEKASQRPGRGAGEAASLHLLSLAWLHSARQGEDVNQPAPHIVFASQRRLAARRRARAMQQHAGAARYLLDDMVEDVQERLAFLRHEPGRALIIGDWTGQLGAALRARGVAVEEAEPADGFTDELPFPGKDYDLIASLGVLDTVNDLPGALIHIRNALAPGGLALASFVAAGSLPALRAAMLESDGERPAPRLHPAVDVRAGGQLLQRAGWARPVVDNRHLDVRFSSLNSLVTDLRAQALGNCLANPGPSLGKSAYARAVQAFGAGTVERFEILTLSGWRP